MDDVILGAAETPFEELLLGRLLRASSRLHRQENMNGTHRFLITSVFNERGRTTPCNFYDTHRKPFHPKHQNVGHSQRTDRMHYLREKGSNRY